MGRRMRRAGVAGAVVQVKLRLSDFTTYALRHSLTHPTDDERVFVPEALVLVKSVWNPGIGIRLIGIGMAGFGSTATQLALSCLDGPDVLEPVPDETRQRMLVRQIDEIHAKFGSSSLVRGAVSLSGFSARGLRDGSEHAQGDAERDDFS